jgi:hypothetical protein
MGKRDIRPKCPGCGGLMEEIVATLYKRNQPFNAWVCPKSELYLLAKGVKV